MGFPFNYYLGAKRTMTKHNAKHDIKIMAIDLAKTSFQLHGADASGCNVLRKKLSRKKLPEFMVKLPPCLVVMEACGSAHYWARLFQSYGHEVRLIAPQFVKPFVKSNKNDAVDAEAICEAVQRPGMRFVAIKSVEQQDIQSLHRRRSQLIKYRTAHYAVLNRGEHYTVAAERGVGVTVFEPIAQRDGLCVDKA